MEEWMDEKKNECMEELMDRRINESNGWITIG